MPRELNGHSDGSGLRIGIVVARFNSYITDRMLESALARLVELGVSDADVTVAHVPGAFELPVTAAAMARSDNYDSVICIGAVIEGETAHVRVDEREAVEESSTDELASAWAYCLAKELGQNTLAAKLRRYLAPRAIEGFTVDPYTTGLFLMGEHLEQGAFHAMIAGPDPTPPAGG